MTSENLKHITSEKRTPHCIFPISSLNRLICGATTTINNIVSLRNLCTSKTNSKPHQVKISKIWSPIREGFH